MKNLGEILKTGKSGFDSVIKTTIYLIVAIFSRYFSKIS
jgi:hypothetical protein